MKSKEIWIVGAPLEDVFNILFFLGKLKVLIFIKFIVPTLKSIFKSKWLC